ncbi:MAG TPA: response regulator [Chloroflexota bacterium]|nr:response regulator [Chloroflexota bacterium]
MTDDTARILVVDDTPQNIRLLDAVLTPRGYDVIPATSGQEALNAVAERSPDLILLDIQMPVMDGYEVCRRIREEPATRALPIVMITAAGDQEKLRALEAGADEFIAKPFNQAELLARVKSLLRIKRYHDTIEAQTAELASWNRSLEDRVQEQVEQMSRMARLQSFLSPQVAEAIVSSGDESALGTHRRQIAVLFCDLRGFTAFSETAEPEEVMTVLREYHSAAGPLIARYEGTVGHFAGDGLMVFFNDPFPCDDPTGMAVQLALDLRERMAELSVGWKRQGWNLGFGVGIAYGYATLGVLGFEGRQDYGVIGTVVNLASRLCDEAQPGQILISQRAYRLVEDRVLGEELPELTLKGFLRPVAAYAIPQTQGVGLPQKA